MKLDKFQEYIKGAFGAARSDEIEIDLDELHAKMTLNYWEDEFQEEYEIVCDEIMNNHMDTSEILGNALLGRESINVEELDEGIKYEVNILIKETLEEIEDIEVVIEIEEDCMDVCKRAREMEK